MEVKRVEILENPTDPKYRGAEFVVNYIVEKYKYGGYTRFSTEDAIHHGIYNASGIFSRFTYKSMTYDLYVNSRNGNLDKWTGSNSVQTLRLTDGEGNPYLYQRTEDIRGDEGKFNRFPVTFLARYNRNNIHYTTSLSFTYGDYTYRGEGSVRMTPSSESQLERTFSGSSHDNRRWYWRNELYMSLDKGWSFDVRLYLGLGDNHFYNY